MGKIRAQSVTYWILPVLLWHFSSRAAATNFTFYENILGCSGTGYSFNDVGDNVCCAVGVTNGGAVLVDYSTSSKTSSVYKNGGCTTNIYSAKGNFCVIGGLFTGALVQPARRRSLLSGSQKCDSQMKPDGVVYTETGLKGHWVLTTDDVFEMYAQMQNITNAEKVKWLQSLGANFISLGSEVGVEELFL